MATEEPSGRSFESATSVFGRKVQKAMRISTAEMKTDGTQPFVNLESTSPSRMMTRQAAKAETKLYMSMKWFLDVR